MADEDLIRTFVTLNCQMLSLYKAATLAFHISANEKEYCLEFMFGKIYYTYFISPLQ